MTISMKNQRNQAMVVSSINPDLTPIQSTSREDVGYIGTTTHTCSNKQKMDPHQHLLNSIENLQIQQSYRDNQVHLSRQASAESQNSSKGINNLTLVDKNIFS